MAAAFSGVLWACVPGYIVAISLFAYGAVIAEGIVYTLTGEYKRLRSDILHDVCRLLNPAVVIG
jgi:xanthine dehydrogenase molybdopterin-binding subunit B